MRLLAASAHPRQFGLPCEFAEVRGRITATTKAPWKNHNPCEPVPITKSVAVKKMFAAVAASIILLLLFPNTQHCCCAC